jgi:hypothetical protein
MSEVSRLSPELAQGLLQLARALLVAARNWVMYAPEHPVVGQSVARFCEAVRESSFGAIFSIGITPDTLLVEGVAADRGQTAVAEAAALLHERDLLQVTFIGDILPEAAHAFLALLALDATERRRRGGPARIWASSGHRSIVVQQIEYERMLAREDGKVPEPAKRDDLWRSIIWSIAGGQKAVLDERAQERLLAIAGSPADIGDLAQAVMAPQVAADGSPLITSQAAAVLAAYRYLTNIVAVMSPERLSEVMGNVATATTPLDPHVVIQLIRTEEDPADGVPVAPRVAGAFDDGQVAQLLATALALDGRASDRLATVFSTIVPDEERKQRVLTLTRSLLSATPGGQSEQFQALSTSLDQLLLSYDDKRFVSDSYRATMDGLGDRAETMAARSLLPPDVPEWMDSVGQENVRALSVTLLIDLLTLERDAVRADSIVVDMEGLTEDLLLSGAYDDASRVTQALATRASAPGEVGSDACRLALDRLGESFAMREAAALVGEIDESGWSTMRRVIETVGAATVESLKPNVMVEEDTVGSGRSADAIVGFGAAAVTRLGPLVLDARWFVQRNGARLLGRIATPDTVPLIQPLLRKADPRVLRQAVAALASVDDPSAARAIQTVLRAATGELRQAVIDALVAGRDPRVVPMLARIVAESRPLAKDHEIVLGALSALGEVGSDQAVPAIVAVVGRRSIFRRRKLRALKERGADALVKIGSSNAADALVEASRTGDRMLKKIVAARRT